VLTSKGAKTFLTPEQEAGIVRKWSTYWTGLRKQREAEAPADDSRELTDVPPDDGMEDLDLLTVLRSLSPSGFEKICQRLLRAHGFERVAVTGGPHDWGIDGT